MPNVTIPAGWQTPLVKLLNREHPEYADAKMDWRKIEVLYKAGRSLRKQATEFLQRRPKELQEVYQARLDMFIDRGILGTVLGWYRAALFKTDPTVEGGVVDKKGEPTGKLGDQSTTWYNAFQENCDRRGTSLTDTFRETWTDSVLYGKAYMLVDLPNAVDAATLKDQQTAGVVDSSGKPQPYLVPYSPLSVINWEVDEYDNLLWAVICVQKMTQEFVGSVKVTDIWYYFDREKYLVYARDRRKNELAGGSIPDDATAKLIDSGYHALRAANMVPLLRFEIPDTLYLGNRVFSSIVGHLNQDNSYSWALHMSNLAMPVISTDRDFKPTLTETGFIKLPEGAKYEWSEPSGRSFVTSAERVRELREDIYRAMYLTYQGRDSNATADGASGVSKEMDMMPAIDVMNEYGDLIVAFMQNTLNSVSIARKEPTIKWDVRGMSFGKTTTLGEIQNTEATLAIGVPSDTFEKETWKQFARGRMPDANPEILAKIDDEIDAAPSQEERMQQAAQQRTSQYGKAMDGAVKQFNQAPQPATPPKPKRSTSRASELK